MSIVFLTIQGESKQDFATKLNEVTGGAVDCVIVQKPKKVSFLKTLLSLRKTVGVKEIPRELWYGLLLRLDKELLSYLDFFRARTKTKRRTALKPPKVIEVHSINSARVEKIMKAYKPKVLVVWGTGIVEPFIFKEAKHAINLHMGFCPYYRGAPANQFAVLSQDFEKIGATIHYLHEKVDAGEIIQRIALQKGLPPSKLFRQLNDDAEQKLITTVQGLLRDEKPATIPQNNIRGRNVLLREWVPSRRYEVAKILQSWERSARSSEN